ncbi:MAG: bifunctional diguanylate cyclase/phosphodiesterase [Rubrivivax sp.]|nr:bifunctional diguanylate cyclase/phosphodiesterase [Rubrivivax sp.]
MGPLATAATAFTPTDVLVWFLVTCVFASLTAVALYRRLSRRLNSRLDAARSQLDELRGRDSLTGLLAGPDFEAALDDAVRACDQGTAPVALLYIDLDDFRTLNDGYGRRVGDAVLVEAARRLALSARGRSVASRLGGDEFAVLLAADLARASDAAAALLQALQRPYEIEGLKLQLTASVGIAVYPDHGSRPRLLRHALLAMRAVKLGGGGALAHYDPTMAVDVREQAEMLQDLRLALERGELQLYYQPKIDALSLQVTAAEALLRWQHPQRGMVSPAVFVPLAERHGLIVPIGRWVIEEACRQAAQWRDRGLRMRMAINISGHQLRQDDLVSQILATLQHHGIPPGRFTCEITETVAMEDTGHTRAAFARLKQAGLHISIDDFGTGQSSLASLRRLPAAELKIDRAFVTDLADNASARSIVQAIMQMAHSLGLRVVAEGVETEAQRDALVALGCDELQGYLFAKPMTATALALWADRDSEGQGDAMFRPSLFDATAPLALGP